MTLVLEVEYLSGVSFAAIGPDSEIPDWPPQPDRIFSALVATWASRGQDGQEAEALEWLERLPPPRILATDAEPRTGAIIFVPPNDPRSGRQKNAKGVLPALRNRQPRRFPATRPHDSVVRLLWMDAEPEEQVLAALKRLAHDTAYIGHSASLTRCCFLLDSGAPLQNAGKAPDRRVYKERFAELRRAFDTGQRPLRGARVVPPSEPVMARANLFGERWLLLEHVAGEMPDLRACALVARGIRDTVLSGYQRVGLGDRIPEEVSGHAPDGSPTRAPHLAIVPLAFTGFPYADGHIIGFALVPPHYSAILDDDDFRRVLRTLAPLDDQRERRVLTVGTKEGTPNDRSFSIDLAPTFEAVRRSLDPALYIRRAQTFATVTPVVLDRHLKEKGELRQNEIEVQIAKACRNIGLPEPKKIVAHKHSAVEGTPSARPSDKSPKWMYWRLPQLLASRQLVHAALYFVPPVEGPVILGAGRFLGLGLCRPIDEEK